MASRKPTGLTGKEQALIRNLGRGKNISRSALEAGYSAKHPGQSGWQALQNIRLKMPEILDKYGLTDEALIEKYLKPLLEAKEVQVCQSKGKVTGTRRVPANAIRLKALDLAFRLKGSYTAPSNEKSDEKGIEVIVVDLPRPQNRPRESD